MEAFGVTTPKQKNRPAAGKKLFTLEHANRTLPLVSKIVADIVMYHKNACRLEEICQSPAPSESKIKMDLIRQQYDIQLDKLRTLRDELSTVGCQLKDWRRGIVDFLSEIEGRPIELCWRLGEQQIEHWHEAGAGFRGRQPIDADFIAECRKAQTPI